MTTKNLPGFSAETALVRSRAPYQPVDWKAAKAAGTLIPQADKCVCDSGGTNCCCCTQQGCKCFPI